MIGIRWAMLSAVALWIVGCAAGVPPTAKAAEVERLQCDSDSTEASIRRLLRGVTVLEATPVYSHVITKQGGEKRVGGARIVLRRPEDLSMDQLARVLQCHSARALLGQADFSEMPDDPFWLQNTWVDIEVEAAQGNYVVKLEANTVRQNLLLAARAKAFASAVSLRPAAAYLRLTEP
jgi:hypothetical protein